MFNSPSRVPLLLFTHVFQHSDWPPCFQLPQCVIRVVCRLFKIKKHALFLCRCTQMCSLRLQYADLFHDFPMAHKIIVNQTRAFYSSQACSEDVFSFFPETNKLFLSLYFRAYGFFLWLVFTSNLISQTTWLKVKLKLVNFVNSVRYTWIIHYMGRYNPIVLSLLVCYKTRVGTAMSLRQARQKS